MHMLARLVWEVSREWHEMRFVPSFPKEGEDFDPSTAVGGYKGK